MERKLLSEFVGTFALLFLGAGAIISGKADLTGIALAHGIAIAVSVCAFAGISGAHFNPAVSAVMFATKRINFQEFCAFVAAQLAGATMASIMLFIVFGSANGYGLPAIGDSISVSGGFIHEAIGTALLVFVIFGVAVDSRGTFKAVAGLPIGLVIAAVIMSGGPITGAALNPARWFGPALVSGDWTNAWLYILAPTAGALIAGFIYQIIAKPEQAITKSVAEKSTNLEGVPSSFKELNKA